MSPQMLAMARCDRTGHTGKGRTVTLSLWSSESQSVQSLATGMANTKEDRHLRSI